ncbi:hypothetical protein GWO13_03585 [Candidatus Bathyarchaeota archaeon]|nr:hypothetical protein [Candidatus Bathyarchaeota archaeon]
MITRVEEKTCPTCRVGHLTIKEIARSRVVNLNFYTSHSLIGEIRGSNLTGERSIWVAAASGTSADTIVVISSSVAKAAVILPLSKRFPHSQLP